MHITLAVLFFFTSPQAPSIVNLQLLPMKLPLLSLLCLSLACGGCALVPSPYSAQLNPAIERYGTIESGTTRADIEARLGKPTREEDGAYIWETRFDDKNYALVKVWFETSDKAGKVEITKAHGKSTPGFHATAVVTRAQ